MMTGHMGGLVVITADYPGKSTRKSLPSKLQPYLNKKFEKKKIKKLIKIEKSLVGPLKVYIKYFCFDFGLPLFNLRLIMIKVTL